MGHKNVFAVLLWMVCFGGLKGQSTDSLTVHFASNQAVLLPEDRTTLDRWFEIATSRLISIQLIGYCDSVGANRYNDSLSQQRITMVKEYLESKGMADTLFTVLRAFGKRKPLNDNGDEEKRSLNRRVTILGRLTAAAPGLKEALLDTAAAGKFIRQRSTISK